MIKPWKPRGSSLGAYANCLWRAAQDRLVYQGELPAPPEQRDTSAASLGNCEHFTLQDGIRCTFPAKKLNLNPTEVWDRLDSGLLVPERMTADEKQLVDLADNFFDQDLVAAYEALARGDSRCYQPTKATWEDAAELWKGNMDHCREQVRAAASLGAGKIPVLPAGQFWSAEDSFENEFVSGHTDFLRPDRKVFGDLKTTAKPPKGGWLKTEHLMQMTAYRILTGAERAWVLYLDSQKARWVNLVWIDFTTDAMKFYADQVAEFCQFLMSDRLFDAAYPNLGDHCVYSWCKHKADCYSRIMPPPGSLYNVTVARKHVGPIRLTPV